MFIYKKRGAPQNHIFTYYVCRYAYIYIDLYICVYVYRYTDLYKNKGFLGCRGFTHIRVNAYTYI